MGFKKIILILFLLFISIGSASASVSFGFWPSNTNPETYQPNWTALTHVANLDWNLNANGELVDKNSDTTRHCNIIFTDAKANGVKTLIGCSTGNRNTMDSILAYHQDDFAQNISNKINSTGAEGIIFDFEYVQDANSLTGQANAPLFESLMKKVNAKVKAVNSSYWVCLCTSGNIDEGMDAYNNPNLTKYLDAVFAMCYDMNYPERYTRANSPFYNDFTRLGLRHSVEQQTAIFGKDKLIIGLPLYGYDYIASSNKAGANITSEYGYVYLRDVPTAVAKNGRQWDNESQTPWYWYQLNGSYHQVWYDDAESLALKNNYIKEKGCLGVGFWALGHEGNNATILSLFNVTKNETVTPNVTANDSNTSYGITLGSEQLNAKAVDPKTGKEIPGTFVYTPGAGTILGAGTHTLSVVFTPNDLKNYTTASKTITINVSQVTPQIIWSGN